MTIRRPGLPRSMATIRKDELEALRVKARERDDYLAAIGKMQPKRHRMMAALRGGTPSLATDKARASGWLEYEADLGRALVEVMWVEDRGE